MYATATLLAVRAREKHLELAVDVRPDVPALVRGDPTRVRQVLMNLIGNAIKFTEEGEVAVAAALARQEGDRAWVEFRVRDTGIGIPPQQLGTIFEEFTQADASTTRRYGGTGLGLAICRHLVQLMGGSIELSSRLGEGTKVTLELRLPVAQRDADRPPELAGRHAIVRLASAGVASALAAHLTTLGLTVEQIPPAQPMRRGAAANLLFIDAGDQESAATIAAQPILVDTGANGSSGMREREEHPWLHANPLKWQAVSRICVQALQPLAQPARGAAPSAPAIATPGGRVLVAEDHPISQTLIRRQLGLLGWACDVVGDGHAALAALRQHDYAMLLTDCQMPLMNGYELATAWRHYEAQTNRHTRLPIIAMTANALDGEIERCRDAGMDDYLSKPVQLRPLEDKLRAWAPQTKADPPAAEPVFFEDVFAAPGMEDLRAQMLQAMLKTSAADMQKLEDAIAQADGELAQRTLHRVLGALQLFTNGRVMADGRALMAADAGRALVALPGYLKNLRSALDDLAQRSA